MEVIYIDKELLPQGEWLWREFPWKLFLIFQRIETVKLDIYGNFSREGDEKNGMALSNIATSDEG